MSEPGKVTASHLSRAAVIYVRQSTLIQVERNTESTARQYDLVNRARQLGWPREAVRVIDGDLGVSGSVTGQRDGFEGMVAEVALGQVGIILALEVSRLARDNAAWYRLLDLAGVCDTLVPFDFALGLGVAGLAVLLGDAAAAQFVLEAAASAFAAREPVGEHHPVIGQRGGRGAVALDGGAEGGQHDGAGDPVPGSDGHRVAGVVTGSRSRSRCRSRPPAGSG
jgi:Resolvase, N terminal domain